MKIRQAKSNDLPLLAKLDKLTNLTNWQQEEYQSSFNNKNHYMHVLENDINDVIGVIVTSVILDEAEILQFWIKNTSKQRGYGKILLAHVLDTLRVNRVLRVFLEVREDNIPAIRLYEKSGFVVVGRRNNYYTVDCWHYDALTLLLNT